MLNRKGGLSRSLAAVVAAGLVFVQGLAWAQARPFEELVPDDVTGFATLRNYRATLDRLKGTPYGALFSEPEVKALFDQVAQLISEKADLPWAEGAPKLADVEKLLGGEIAMVTAIVPPEAGGTGAMGMPAPPKTGMLFLVDVGPNGEEAERLLEQVIQMAVEKGGAEVTEDEFQGHAIRQVAPPKPEAEAVDETQLEDLDPELREMILQRQAGPEPQHVYLCLEDGILAVELGPDRNLLERHLVLRDGGDIRPLAQADQYRRLLERIDADSDYVSYQNLEPLWSSMGQAAGMGPMMMLMDPAQMLKSLGLTKMKAQIGGARVEEKAISGRSFVLCPAPRTGILRAAVPTVQSNVKPPAFVGDDAAVYGGVYFDVPTLWEEIKAFIKQSSPAMYDRMMQGINDPAAPVQVERDLIQTIGSHWFVYVPREVVSANPPKEINVILAAELKDSETLEKTIQALLATVPPDAGFSTVDFNGKTIYQTPPLPIPLGEDMGPLSFCWVFADGKLILATSQAMAKLAVRDSQRAESPLLEKDEFRATLPQMISHPDALFYADQRYIGEWVWKLANKLLEGKEVRLPSFETLRKYLSVTTTTAKWTEDGLEMRSWNPYPAQ